MQEQDLKTEMEAKAKRSELEDVSENAVFDKKGKLFLDHF